MADGTPPAEEAGGLFSSIVGAVGSSLRYAADTVNRCPTLSGYGSKVKSLASGIAHPGQRAGCGQPRSPHRCGSGTQSMHRGACTTFS